MRKWIVSLLVPVLFAGVFSGCAKTAETHLKVGASATPHAEILEVAKEVLKEKGYTLEIVIFDDYVLPNKAVNDKELDANYFQHLPYLVDFNPKNNTNLVSAGAIHFEPFAIYGGKTAKLEDLADGATVGVPDDATNEARALALLEKAGLIKLKAGVGLEATKLDIVENPKNLVLQEIKAEQLPRSLPDLDIAAINGNYAIQGGLKINKDALFVEDAQSVGAKTYGNIIAVRAGDENRAAIKALIEALNSQKVKDFIANTYEGGVVHLG